VAHASPHQTKHYVKRWPHDEVAADAQQTHTRLIRDAT